MFLSYYNLKRYKFVCDLDTNLFFFLGTLFTCDSHENAVFKSLGMGESSHCVPNSTLCLPQVYGSHSYYQPVIKHSRNFKAGPFLGYCIPLRNNVGLRIPLIVLFSWSPHCRLRCLHPTLSLHFEITSASWADSPPLLSWLLQFLLTGCSPNKYRARLIQHWYLLLIRQGLEQWLKLYILWVKYKP